MIGDITNKAIPFILLPIIANYIDVNSYGIYSTEVLVYSFFSNLLPMELQAKIILDVVKDNNKADKTIHYSLINTILFSLCVYIFLILFSDKISKTLNLNGNSLEIIFYVSVIQAIINLILSRLQAFNKVTKFISVNISFTLGYFLSLLYSIFFGNWDDIWNNILLSYLLLFFIYLTYSYFKGDLLISRILVKNDFCFTKKILSFGLFQLPHVMSSWVRLGYDRIILAGVLTMTTVGGYSAALQIGLISSVVFQALNKFLVPFIIKQLEVKNKKLIKIITNWISCYCYYFFGQYRVRFNIF